MPAISSGTNVLRLNASETTAMAATGREARPKESARVQRRIETMSSPRPALTGNHIYCRVYFGGS
jgi:hypothetical protein